MFLRAVIWAIAVLGSSIGNAAAPSAQTDITPFLEKLRKTGTIGQETLCVSSTDDKGCTEVPPEIVRRLLVDKSLSFDQIPPIVRMVAVKITGNLDLRGQEILRAFDFENGRTGEILLDEASTEYPFQVCNSLIDGKLTLRHFSSSSFVSLIGTSVGGFIDGDQANVDRGLTATNLEAAKEVRFNRLKIEKGDLDLSNAASSDPKSRAGAPCFVTAGTERRLGSRLDLTDAIIGRSVWLGGRTVDDDMNMSGAVIGHDLVLDGTKGMAFGANNAQIDGTLSVKKADFPALDIQGAVIGKQVAFVGTSMGSEAVIKAANVKVGGRFDGRCPHLQRLELGGAQIAIDVDLRATGLEGVDCANNDRSRVVQEIWAEDAAIGGTFSIEGISTKIVRLQGATIGNQADIRASMSSDGALFLDSATIKGNLVLWPKGGRQLSLLDTNVEGLSLMLSASDMAGCTEMPERLKLVGLTYKHLDGKIGDKDGDKILHGEDYLLNCVLGRDEHFAYQPYLQMATTLREFGRPSVADSVMRKANFRDLDSAAEQDRYFDWFGSLLLLGLVGWGIGWGYLLAAAWVVIFTAIGAIFLAKTDTVPPSSEQQLDNPLKILEWRICASLSKFLPAASLGKEFDFTTSRMGTGCRFYFTFHVIMGYVLGILIAAGIAGMTQSH